MTHTYFKDRQLPPQLSSVWLNKNYKIGVYAHCILNIGGDIALWGLLFSL